MQGEQFYGAALQVLSNTVQYLQTNNFGDARTNFYQNIVDDAAMSGLLYYVK
jgi:hypothetical protein